LLAALDRPSGAATGVVRAFAPVDKSRLKHLTVSARPARRAHLRFVVRGLPHAPARATLRLFALRASRVGFVVRDARRNGVALGRSGALVRGHWAVVNVTRAVHGNGTASFTLTTSSGRAIALASREAGPRFAPRLEVELAAPPRPGGPPAVPSAPSSGDPPPSSPAGAEAPTISGKPWATQVLTASQGAWTGSAPIAFSWQWQRCKSDGACVDIPSATAADYTLADSDIGSTVRVVVTATNAVGSSSAISAPTATIIPVPTAPKATAAPVITGAAQDRQMLRASTGKWTGTAPIALTYQWLRCDKSGSNCAPVDGASDAAYPVGSVDVGYTIRVAVSASNPATSVTETSKQTPVVAPVPPALSGGVSIWHFDEMSGATAADSSGHSSGKAKNVTVGQAGMQNTAYRFNGRSSLVVVPSSSRLNPGSSPFTITVHVSFTQNPSSSVGDYDVIRKGRADTLGGEYKMEILQGGKALCAFKGSSGSATVTGASALNDGAWHTLQCIKRSSSVSLVVDGKSYSSGADVGSISNDAPLAIGAKAEGGDWYMGLIDEVGYALN
jgi:hypothetical protein